MASEWIELLVRVNLAMAAGIAIVMALRIPARRLFGARVAYALWLLPLAAAAMCFVPGRVQHIVLDPQIAALSSGGSGTEAVAQPPYLLWAWIIGAALSLVVLALRQARFTQALGRLHKRDDLGVGVRSAQSCAHGPAVIGVLRPLIITPADFERRFDAEEQRIVLAHERAHLAHGDPWINALVVLIKCVNWFNPFVHIGARTLRLDQELACDAAVLSQSEGLRRRYAEAILKTHIAAAAPIGCSWPPSDLNALKERITMLKRNLPSRTQTLLGGAAVVIVTAGVAAAAWAAQPTRLVATIAPTENSALQALAQLDEHQLAIDDSMASLESLSSLTSLAALERLPDDPDLAGAADYDGEARIVRNGRVIREEDMTPEDRAELRRALDEAELAREAAREAQAEAREHMREARESAIEARRQASEAHTDHDRQAAREAEQQARQEALEARQEALQIRAEAMAEVRVAMAEMERELAALSVEERAYARDALREAHREIAAELQQARSRGDRTEIEALEIAERSLRDAARD